MSNKYSSKRSVEHLWLGPFETLDEAKSNSNAGIGFEGDQWKNRIVDILKHYRSLSAVDGRHALPPRPSNLPLVVSALKPQKIIDFGGSSGWSWSFLKNVSFNHQVKKYTVIELESVCDFIFEEELHADKEISFQSDVPEDDFDLLYVNSALQYLQDNSEFLRCVQSSSPSHILLDDLIASDLKQDFFGLQKYFTTLILYRFLSLSKLLGDMREIGYSCELMTPFLSPVRGELKELPMDNFPISHRIKHSTTLLLNKT